MKTIKLKIDKVKDIKVNLDSEIGVNKINSDSFELNELGIDKKEL